MKKLPLKIILNIPYKKQLDNLFNPTGTCNVTSFAMILEFFGVPRRAQEVNRDANKLQLEDELWLQLKRFNLNYKDPYDLAKIAEYYGVTDEFKTRTSFKEIKEHIASGNPCITHGYFTSSGHIIVLVGYDDMREAILKKLNGFIVHDPYGEWFESGYDTNRSGAFLNYSYDLIKRKCNFDDQFWVHFLKLS